MISDVYVDIECDWCGYIEHVPCPVVYSNLYGKDPHVDLRDSALSKLLPQGWRQDGDKTYCEDCSV